MISDAVFQAYREGFATPDTNAGMEAMTRAGLEAAFAQARREIAHEALKAPVDPIDRDLLRRASRFMAQCGPCDFGLAEFACSHPDEDYRRVVADLVTEVERLRSVLAGSAEVVVVSKEAMDALTEHAEWRSAMEAAGVDSWEGYPHAMSIYHRMDEEDETPEEREAREAAEDEQVMEENPTPQEFIEALSPFGEAAYYASVPEKRDGPPWCELSETDQLHWTKVADGVLYAYDAEWSSIKAGY